MAEVSRDTNPNIQFKSSVVPLTTTGNQFSITLDVYNNTNGMKLGRFIIYINIGFFVIVISAQTSFKIIDLVNIGKYVK